MTRAQADEAWANARAQAEEVFRDMVEKNVIADVSPDDFELVLVELQGTVKQVLVPKTDEGKAASAIKELAVLALGPIPQRDKLGALKTLLEFTKAKPTTKVEVNKAEDVLAAALKDIQKDGAE
jgi:hypothetical protein